MSSNARKPAVARGIRQDFQKQIDDPALIESAALAQAANIQPSTAVLDLADELQFASLIEAADLAIKHSKQLRRAAVRGDRLRSKLHVCQASRSIRTALTGVAELCRDRRRA
jgi:hypothetical protein